jgi:hypothetical protein
MMMKFERHGQHQVRLGWYVRSRDDCKITEVW